MAETAQPDFSLEGKKADAEEQKDPRQGLPPTVEVQQASAPLNLDAAKRTDPAGQYVQYNGIGTVRQLDPESWKAAHVDSENTYVWNYLNNKRIPRSAFSDEELQYLLRVDGRFSLVEVKDEKANGKTK